MVISICYFTQISAWVIIIIIITSAEENVRSSLFVCLIAILRKNFWMDLQFLHEIVREGWQWASEQMIKFWWRSGWRIHIRMQIMTLVRHVLVEVCTAQGCGLGLDVSVSRRTNVLSQVSSRRKLSTSRSRLGLRMLTSRSRLGLGHWRLVPIPGTAPVLLVMTLTVGCVMNKTCNNHALKLNC